MIGGPDTLGNTELKGDVKNDAINGGEEEAKREGDIRERKEGRLMMVVMARRADRRMEGDGEQQRG